MCNTVVVLFLLLTGFSSRAGNFEKHYGIGFVTVDIDSINSLPCWLQPERSAVIDFRGWPTGKTMNAYRRLPSAETGCRWRL